ncbi:frataxin homolog, mitochondrial [Drosophila bipectinata]|uniref:frataxin homolog, mitochondrial n=1 Tax=Drosophila bipectinata TaxID=42026 RepID=UPI001C89ED72|nr:frataxin homolog, mitochondrial [Drosophila bipectinata]
MFTARLLPRLQLHRPILARIRCLPRSADVAGEGKLSGTTNTGLSPVSGGSLVHRRLFGSQVDEESSLDSATYERVCSETLDALCDYFEELTENAQDLPGSDVAYGDGVLTVNLGQKHGTYVINRQTPNKQIWLSSPTSGPKRFDFVGSQAAGRWVYKHSGQSLHDLLQQEIPSILKAQSVNFHHLPYCS